MENLIKLSSSELKGKGKWFYLLTLMRPANVLTSATNILAGIAIAGYVSSSSYWMWPSFNSNYIDILYLLIGSCLFYSGGVVFNDVFDHKLDSIERPERPLPSGRVLKGEAILLGTLLFLIGIVSTFLVNIYSGIIGCAIVLLALLYNYKSKHNKIVGPINMGMCRALNLCLGISISPEMLAYNYWYAFIPLLYIMAITLISHGEVNGGNSFSLKVALELYISLFIVISYLHPTSILFVSLWAMMIIFPLLSAIKKLDAALQRKAVKAGVLAVVLMDATIASGFSGFYYPLIILLFLPASIFISKLFSVT